MSRWTHAKIISRMWGAGMPRNDRKVSTIFFAARKAGLDDQQAFCLASIAFHASEGYLEHLATASRGLRAATLERKANELPQSLWAYVKHKLGGAYRYCTDEDIREIHHNDFAGWSAWSEESSQLASAHHSVQQLGSAATVTDGGVVASTSGPEATALQGTCSEAGLP